jgi:hypothetical protein
VFPGEAVIRSHPCFPPDIPAQITPENVTDGLLSIKSTSQTLCILDPIRGEAGLSKNDSKNPHAKNTSYRCLEDCNPKPGTQFHIAITWPVWGGRTIIHLTCEVTTILWNNEHICLEVKTLISAEKRIVSILRTFCQHNVFREAAEPVSPCLSGEGALCAPANSTGCNGTKFMRLANRAQGHIALAEEHQ